MSKENSSAGEEGDPGVLKETGRVLKAFASLAPGPVIARKYEERMHAWMNEK